MSGATAKIKFPTFSSPPQSVAIVFSTLSLQSLATTVILLFVLVTSIYIKINSLVCPRHFNITQILQLVIVTSICINIIFFQFLLFTSINQHTFFSLSSSFQSNINPLVYPRHFNLYQHKFFSFPLVTSTCIISTYLVCTRRINRRSFTISTFSASLQ